MFRKTKTPAEHDPEVDLIPMMDLSLNLTFFFVVLTTLARDEVSQRVSLPVARTAVLVQEETIPDSLNINVDHREFVLSWGTQLDLNSPQGLEKLGKLLRMEAARQKDVQPNWKKDGLSTTIVLRVDRNAHYGVFRKVVNVCRQNGFKNFLLKARAEE
ncbi:MAG: biopolymer transporter ExbD [Planctomycetota bacterium]